MASDRQVKAIEFESLKEKVKAEMLRRNGYGPLTSYGSSLYDYLVAAQSNNPLKLEHMAKNHTPLTQISPLDLPSDIDPILHEAEMKQLEAKVVAAASMPMNSPINDCSAMCSGLCVTTCSGFCKETCTGTCEGGCKETCKGLCKETCLGGCDNTCKGGCTGDCGTSCAKGCGTNCTGGCSDTCGVDCISDCTKGCTPCTSCRGCGANCVGECGSGCETYCSTCAAANAQQIGTTPKSSGSTSGSTSGSSLLGTLS